jgi:hypothetical protein
MEEVKKRAAAADAAATEASSLKAQVQSVQEQLTAAMSNTAAAEERCAELQHQLQVHSQYDFDISRNSVLMSVSVTGGCFGAGGCEAGPCAAPADSRRCCGGAMQTAAAAE